MYCRKNYILLQMIQERISFKSICIEKMEHIELFYKLICAWSEVKGMVKYEGNLF